MSGGPPVAGEFRRFGEGGMVVPRGLPGARPRPVAEVSRAECGTCAEYDATFYRVDLADGWSVWLQWWQLDAAEGGADGLAA